jgi:hypothetical protein
MPTYSRTASAFQVASKTGGGTTPTTTTGGYKIYIFTAGTGTVSW